MYIYIVCPRTCTCTPYLQRRPERDRHARETRWRETLSRSPIERERARFHTRLRANASSLPSFYFNTL